MNGTLSVPNPERAKHRIQAYHGNSKWTHEGELKRYIGRTIAIQVEGINRLGMLLGSDHYTLNILFEHDTSPTTVFKHSISFYSLDTTTKE